MIALLHREDCCGCSACASACPHGAIRMEADGMGFRYPVIDKDLCVDCGICNNTCAFKPLNKPFEPKAEAIRFPDYLDNSQSGGLAYAVMRKAIENGYIVYGAAMDDDFTVRHRRVQTPEGLEPLRLSKYVQSDMDGIPSQVLADLKAGHKVLFTGTPCQCAGVASLCAGHRDALLLADIICRAVPSPAFWKSFLEEKQKSGKLKRVLFRDPALGWKNTMARLDYEDRTEHTQEYYFFFINNLINRPSCGQCPFVTAHPSDITMGDCWGVEKLLPGFVDDGLGCSLLLTNTPSGEAFTDSFSVECRRHGISMDAVLSYSARSSAPMAGIVEKKYICKGYAGVNARYGVNSPREKFKKMVRRIIK